MPREPRYAPHLTRGSFALPYQPRFASSAIEAAVVSKRIPQQTSCAGQWGWI